MTCHPAHASHLLAAASRVVIASPTCFSFVVPAAGGKDLCIVKDEPTDCRSTGERLARSAAAVIPMVAQTEMKLHMGSTGKCHSMCWKAGRLISLLCIRCCQCGCRYAQSPRLLAAWALQDAAWVWARHIALRSSKTMPVKSW